MKRYFLPLAAALAFALGLAGGALAGGHPAKSHPAKRPASAAARGHVHSLIPSFAPHPRAWLQALREFPHKQTPRHKAKPAHRPAPKRQAPKRQTPKRQTPKRQTPKRKAAQPQPAPQNRLRATTLSIYEHSAHPWILAEQGCSAARRHENGIVVLDFGKPAFHHGGYGTILFSGRFAKNHKI
ncbi:MAG TPA: hypothetical protein VE220_03340, partial [Gaiellaceae bacterium]|nr:hypothetical protein [Gaiellaceae bacterium]